MTESDRAKRIHFSGEEDMTWGDMLHPFDHRSIDVCVAFPMFEASPKVQCFLGTRTGWRDVKWLFLSVNNWIVPWVSRWLRKESLISGSHGSRHVHTILFVGSWKNRLHTNISQKKFSRYILAVVFSFQGGVNSQWKHRFQKDSTLQVEFPTHLPIFPSKIRPTYHEITDQNLLRTSMKPTTPWALARMAVVQLVALAQQRWWKSNVPALTGIWGKDDNQGWPGLRVGVLQDEADARIMNYDDGDYGGVVSVMLVIRYTLDQLQVKFLMDAYGCQESYSASLP